MFSVPRPTVLHYTGSNRDATGIHAVIRQLAQGSHARSLLGVGPDFRAEQAPRVRAWRGPRVADETIGPGNLWPTFCVAWRIRRWLAGGAHRFFHGHSRAGLLVGLWLRLLGARRVVVSVHCYGRQRWFYRLARRCLGERRLIWLSPAMKRHYGLPADTWTGCVPNGLARRWAPEFRRWPGGRPLRVGGAGVMVRWKRWDLMLAALARLPAGVEVEFFHIGGSVDEPDSLACERELRARSAEPPLAGRVHWRGWQPSSSALLQAVDVVVVPSDGEPFSMIALEALFAGVPVIATRGGGPDDFIVEGHNGWLVPPGDAGALAARFEQCLHPSAWEGLRVSPEHFREFSLAGTLAARWAGIYAASDSPEPAEPRTRLGQLAAGLAANLQFSNWPGVLWHRLGRRGAGEFTYVWQDRLRIVCDGGRRDHVALQEIFCRQGYARWLRGCSFPGSRIRYVNVGAHIGAFDLWLRESGLVIEGSLAAELNPETCARGRRNLAANHLEGVRVVNCGVAGEGGTLDFAPSGDSLSDGIFSDQVPVAAGTMRVPLLSLREFIDREAGGSAVFDLLKLDCEGAEYGILRATAPEDLHRFRHILIEFHPEPLGESVVAAYQQLNDAGFFSRRGRPGTFRFVDLFTRGPDGS